MSSKIVNLSELESVLCHNEKVTEGVLHFVSTFKVARFLKVFDSIKSKGFDVSVMLSCLIFFRLNGKSISNQANHRLHFLPKIDDNTFYRLMNNPLMNWRNLLIGFTKQFFAHVKSKGEVLSRINCFVLDDTDLEKSGKTIEFIGRIFSHVTKSYPIGFKMLLLAFWDGKSLISVDFSLHREKGKNGKYGMTLKERQAQFSKSRHKNTPAYKRVAELDKAKNKNAIAMLKRAVKNGLIAKYVLMDSWFVNDYMISCIRAIRNGAMHIIGMCKIDKRKYSIGRRQLNAHQLIAIYARKKSHYSRKYKSRYISLVAAYKGEAVRLFLIQYNGSKKWSLLLTTDLSLSFVQAIELYQIRWSIEVLFKECKQYLRLGCSQNTDFDGQIADVTLALITHTILTLQKRFGSYETMGVLFRETQQHLLELTLWERLVRIFAKMILNLFVILDIDVEETMSMLMRRDVQSLKLWTFLSVISNMSDIDTKSAESDTRFALAS